MENDYVVKISCGKYFAPTLRRMMEGMKMDKEFHINGDVTLADVQSIASRIAISTYEEKSDRLFKEGTGVMSDGVANAFIYSDEGLISAVSAFLEGKEPSIEIYNQEQIEQAMQPVNIDFHGFQK